MNIVLFLLNALFIIFIGRVILDIITVFFVSGDEALKAMILHGYDTMEKEKENKKERERKIACIRHDATTNARDFTNCILIASTPSHGNVIMYFDKLKSKFIYYCDASVPYSHLLRVAEDYVLKFHCPELMHKCKQEGEEKKVA